MHRPRLKLGTARPGAPGWKKQKNMSALWQHWSTYLLWLCKLIYLKYMATTSIQSCIINTYQSWICNMYWYAHLLANIVFQVGKSIMETLESERGIIPTKDDPKKITSDPNRSDRSWCTWRVGGEAPPPSPVKLGTSICTSDVFRQHIL
jgi:hypothetical protein